MRQSKVAVQADRARGSHANPCVARGTEVDVVPAHLHGRPGPGRFAEAAVPDVWRGRGAGVVMRAAGDRLRELPRLRCGLGPSGTPTLAAAT